MPDLYLKKCTCPYCLKTTETKRVLSRHIRVASTDFDGFIRHQGVNVYLYEPVQCSHCRFFFHESFGKLSPDVRTTLQDHILPTLPVLPFAGTERTTASTASSAARGGTIAQWMITVHILPVGSPARHRRAGRGSWPPVAEPRDPGRLEPVAPAQSEVQPR